MVFAPGLDIIKGHARAAGFDFGSPPPQPAQKMPIGFADAQSLRSLLRCDRKWPPVELARALHFGD
jgi:hypothetical protein